VAGVGVALVGHAVTVVVLAVARDLGRARADRHVEIVAVTLGDRGVLAVAVAVLGVDPEVERELHAGVGRRGREVEHLDGDEQRVVGQGPGDPRVGQAAHALQLVVGQPITVEVEAVLRRPDLELRDHLGVSAGERRDHLARALRLGLEQIGRAVIAAAGEGRRRQARS
jgi:hypothetical protein